MISNDVLALIQLDPPGIELCRVSNMKKGEGGEGGDGGATNDRGSQNDGPHMDKLCTLLLPPLRQQRDGTGSCAHVLWVFCVGEHPGHQTFSRGPWPEYRGAPLGRRPMFRQSTKDSIVSVMICILGCEGESRTFEVVVRCATLLAYADGARMVPTATAAVAADAESWNGGGDGRSASAQAQAGVGDANADNDAGVGTDDDSVPWDAWGPRATAVSDDEHVEWSYLLGERRATIEQGVDQICIRDYNPYRIRQASRASMVAKGPRVSGHGLGDSHEEEEEDRGEVNADTFHPGVTGRIVESITVWGGEWFEEDVTTALPHWDIKVDVPGCRAIYMEQDQVLLRVDDIGKVSGMCCCDRLMMGRIAIS
jgi:hypothetical protein